MAEIILGWIATNAVGLLFKTIFTQENIKEFAQDLGKDYLKDFFKDRFNNVPIALFEKEPLQKAIIKALKEFLQIVEDELKLRKVLEADIKKLAKPLKTFIDNKSVKEILGKAFNDDCDSLDYQELAKLWYQLNLPAMPVNFNWQLITENYLAQCKQIIRESSELRSILLGQRLEEILKLLKEDRRITTGFDLAKYIEAIRERYINLKLYRLEKKASDFRINLWQIFITQNVREVSQVLPELPKVYLRQLHENRGLDAKIDLDNWQEELDRYKRNCLQQPIRSVLDVVQEKSSKNYLVILGDPGSGKSTLLHYLALKWVEETLTRKDFSLPIPLLIELNSYMRDRIEGKCDNFLEFYDHAPNCFFHLNQHQLHEQLKAGNALVMFDGLDEIFDPKKREEVITCIHRFTNEYPDVQVIVTSRIIGYVTQPLQDAEFRHFRLEDLDSEQITDFIGRWHERVFNPSEKEEKDVKQGRLQKVIKESKAIAELAGNPLLLTMMAILNLSQELPRDRPELYNQASRVLLHKWDVERALEEDKLSIDDKEKQAMLRQVAYAMQTSGVDVAGNVISEDNLIKILTKYLQEELDINQPKKAAQRIIDQLRTRNFMLCFLGADYYAFVHRSFLEYFCAWEFVWQFKETQTLNIEQLKKEVFGKYWENESWHEVLLLIAGMIDARFVGGIIDYLMGQDGEEKKFTNLFLAAKCLMEVKHRSKIVTIANQLQNKLEDLIKYDLWYYSRPLYDDIEIQLVREIRTQAVTAIAKTWQDDPTTKTFLQQRATTDNDSGVRGTAVAQLAQAYKDDPTTKTILQQRATTDNDSGVRETAVAQLAQAYKDDPTTKTILQQRATTDNDSGVRETAVEQLAQAYKDDPTTKTFLQQLATADNDRYARRTAVQQLAQAYKDDPTTKTILQQRATADNDRYARRTAVEQLAQAYKDDPTTKTFLQQLATADDDSGVRWTAVEQLVQAYKDDSTTKTFLQQLATADDDKYVRWTAVEQLAQAYKDDPTTKTILQQLATTDNDKNVRETAVEQLAQAYKDDPTTKTILQQLATADNDRYARRTAVQQLAQAYKDDTTTQTILQQRATTDNHEDVRRTAVQQLAQAYKDDPTTKTILQQLATADNHEDVRGTAVAQLAQAYKNDPTTKTILQQRATADNHWDVRGTAVNELAKAYKSQPELFETYYNCAAKDNFKGSHNDFKPNPRRVALEIIVKQYPQHPQTLPLLRDRAENDPDEKVREYAQKKLNELRIIN
ncbi:HEAT repeat domain-containing protein [Nostoc sp. MS1]|uniref:HEAT repeat domain-containing protein n=1 Tax=Nostoc sp. MS1 TaxID=2764711 RepID=UPI001CC62CA8|nr:HEAT repeat domain-containing protein [Nostoc sp. MS1]BCL35243.1 hypothetical protein NSMS1_16900 [Nostoc sp. MS1]